MTSPKCSTPWAARPILLVQAPCVPFNYLKLPRPVPFELHDNILKYVLSLDKWTLMSALATCRYWFQRCGPTVFRSIVISSPAHLDRLANCLRTRGLSPIRRFTKVLVIYQDGGHAPWGHRVLGKFAVLLPNLTEVCFARSNSFSPDYLRPTTSSFSLHPNMSKALRAFLSPFTSLHKLRLHDYCLQSVADLLLLAGALPSLRKMELERLTWTHTPGSLPRALRTGHHLVSLELSDCQLTWPMLWLWAAPQTLCKPAEWNDFPGLCARDASYLGEIGRIFFDKTMMCESVCIENRSTPYSNSWIMMAYAPLSLRALQIHITGADPATLPAYIRQITFVNIQTTDLRSMHYVELDEALSQLSGLEIVLFDGDSGHAHTEQAEDSSIAWSIDEAVRPYAILLPSVTDRIRIDSGVARLIWQKTYALQHKPRTAVEKPQFESLL